MQSALNNARPRPPATPPGRYVAVYANEGGGQTWNLQLFFFQAGVFAEIF